MDTNRKNNYAAIFNSEKKKIVNLGINCETPGKNISPYYLEKGWLERMNIH